MIVYKNKIGRMSAIAPYDGIAIEENEPSSDDNSIPSCTIYFGSHAHIMPGSFDKVLEAIEADGAELPEPDEIEPDEIDGEETTTQAPETQPN